MSPAKLMPPSVCGNGTIVTTKATSFLSNTISSGTLFNIPLGRATPSVAVIIPTYNSERLVPIALSSLLKQTVHPSQLVVVIDGSRDQTRQIVEDFARNAPFEVTVRDNEKNSGIGFSRQVGVEGVRDDIDYVSYLSDDDTWHPDFLQYMLNKARPDRIVYCHYKARHLESGKMWLPFQFPDARSRKEFVRVAIRWSMRLEMFVNFSCVMIPKSILNEVPFRKDFRKGEDLAFFLDSLCSGVEYQCLREALATIGVHKDMGSLSWKLEERQKLLKHVAQRLRDLGVSEELLLYGMKGARNWAEADSGDLTSRMFQYMLRHVPPVRRIANLIRRRNKDRQDRRVEMQLETFEYESRLRSKVVTKSSRSATDE